MQIMDHPAPQRLHETLVRHDARTRHAHSIIDSEGASSWRSLLSETWMMKSSGGLNAEQPNADAPSKRNIVRFCGMLWRRRRAAPDRITLRRHSETPNDTERHATFWRYQTSMLCAKITRILNRCHAHI